MVIGCLWKWGVLRPGAFDGKKAREVGGRPAAPLWLLGAGLVLVAQMMGGQVALWVLRVHAEPGKADRVLTLREQGLASAAACAAAMVVGVLVLWLLRGQLAEGKNAGEMTGIRVTREDWGKGLVAVVLAAPVCLVVGYAGQWAYQLFTGEAPSNVGHETLKRILDERASVWAWVAAGVAIVGAPVVEEMVHRGLVQSCVLSTIEGRARTWWAILVSSTLFALVHRLGDAVPWHAIPTLFVLGVALGIAYERTRSLGVPIIMHALFNLGNVVAGMLMVKA